MYNEDEIEVKTTVGEIVDVIGIAAAEICPKDFTEEEAHVFMRPFSRVSQRVDEHFSGENPYSDRLLITTAVIRNMIMKEKLEERS